MFKLPLIIINFKTYKEGTGENALKLAKRLESVARKFKGTIAIAPQFCDIKELSEKIKLPIIAQHIDTIDYGAYTGHILAQSVKEAGAVGTLINHSEKPLKREDVNKAIQIAKRVKLKTFVCVPNIKEAKEVAKFSPDYIAFEVPELISTGRAISREMPKSVKTFVTTIEKINPKIIPLCGAGISSYEDIKAAIELGTKGVIVSKAVVTSRNPEKIISGI